LTDVFGLDFLQSLLGLRGPLYFGGGTPGPTAQQQALSTEQATTNANLNLEENEQRKVILNAMQGTRVFRGSALSRAIASNQAGTVAPTAPGAPSASQQNSPLRTPGAGTSLLDQQAISGSGTNPTGGLGVQTAPGPAPVASGRAPGGSR
jgi:hypothetical protein